MFQDFLSMSSVTAEMVMGVLLLLLLLLLENVTGVTEGAIRPSPQRGRPSEYQGHTSGRHLECIVASYRPHTTKDLYNGAFAGVIVRGDASGLHASTRAAGRRRGSIFLTAGQGLHLQLPPSLIQHNTQAPNTV